MQKKNKAVVFEDGYATVYASTHDLKFQPGPGVYINPDLSSVRGVPPELWEERDGRIMPIVVLKKIKERMMVGEIEATPIDWQRERAEMESRLNGFASCLDDEVRERRLELAKLSGAVNAVIDGSRMNDMFYTNRIHGLELEVKRLRRLAVIGGTALMFLCLLLKII